MFTILQCMDGLFRDIKFDKKLAKQIYLYRVGIVTRSRDHMEFFGGNLLGTHTVWFKDAYEDEFFNIFNLSKDGAEESTRKISTINQTFKISSDTMNLTLMYLIHCFMHATSLTEKQRHDAMVDLAMIFFYRCLCIIISDQFNYKADTRIANQAYANLSMKFLIKKLGTWNKVIDYRAKSLVNKRESIHWRSLFSFDHDDDIVYAINDSQGRIKDIVKGYYSELVSVAEGGGSIAVQKSLGVDMEGDIALREKAPGPEVYHRYLQSIIMDEKTFILNHLVEVAAAINTNTSKRSVREVLEWMSVNSMDAETFKRIDAFVGRTMVLCTFYMDNKMDRLRFDDYVYVVKTLKDLFLSTLSVDPDLLAVRKDGEWLVKQSLGKISDSLMKATRTAVILYLCLLAMSGSK